MERILLKARARNVLFGKLIDFIEHKSHHPSKAKDKKQNSNIPQHSQSFIFLIFTMIATRMPDIAPNNATPPQTTIQNLITLRLSISKKPYATSAKNAVKTILNTPFKNPIISLALFITAGLYNILALLGV